MGKAIDTLMHEHRVIEKVLDALQGCAATAKSGGQVERTTVLEFAEFFKNFADKCHHGKEEDRLFAALVEHGFPKEHGPIAVMLAEHSMGRDHVGVLAEIGNGKGPLTADERRLLCVHAEAYSMMLKAHIQKEDNVLYPMAVRTLPPPVMEKMGEDFEIFEKEIMGEGVHERYHELAHKLMAAFPKA
jgi:hemerythrin-like domain-containing protein